MNTISTLNTADLPRARQIEQRAHAFPWSEQTFASNQGERYLNLQLTVDGEMAAFAITQIVPMRRRCLTSPSTRLFSGVALGERCWNR